MYRVEQQEPSEEFKKAWGTARQFLGSKGGGSLRWIRSDLNPPMAEHLSFAIGNQLFFVFVEAAEADFKYAQKLFFDVCSQADATPCLMPMNKRISAYEPATYGWGLVNAVTGDLVDPYDMVSDELIEMTDWELHDFAIRDVVIRHLGESGFNVFSKQSAMNIDPSIWFEADGKPFWVVVRAARHPQQKAEKPKNIEAIAEGCSHMSREGYFASVVVANGDDPFDPDAESNGNFLPLYRGHEMAVKFKGLEKLWNLNS